MHGLFRVWVSFEFKKYFQKVENTMNKKPKPRCLISAIFITDLKSAEGLNWELRAKIIKEK